MATEESVEQLMHFADDIFKANAIVSIDVKREFCRAILNTGKLQEVTDEKFDIVLLAGLMSGGEDAEEVSKNVYHLNVAVSQASLQIMNTFHPNYRIVNGTDTSHPHATAQGHRALDTRVMVRDKASAGRRVLLDVGGNYISHPKLDIAKSMEVHCCTYKRGWAEHHRQTQRDVAVMQGVEECGKCWDGVQNCDFTSEHAICVHVLPEIDPDDWPKIFESHSIKHMSSVHHHPTDLDNYEKKGYMPYPGMHWELGDDGMVAFHFDNDSSFAYHHRVDWLREYCKPWVRTMPGWDYVIYYEVKAVKHGMLYAEMTRMPLSQVTMHTLHQKLLYVGGETDVMVPVPVFNEKSGLGVSNPSAYDTVYYPVPERIYTWCMCKGISNDTSKPDQPYTRNAMREAVRVINRDRQLNGLNWTDRLQLSTETCEIIGDGIYTSVVVQTAFNKMTVAKLAGQMQRMQRRWGHENLMKLCARSLSLTAVLPYLLLCSELEDAIDVLRVALGAGIYSHEALLPPQHKTPYVVLGKMPLPDIPRSETVGELLPEKVSDEPDITTHEFKLNYYNMFKDQMATEQREVLEKELFPDGKLDQAPSAPPVFVEDEDDVDPTLPSRQEAWTSIVENRVEWLKMFDDLHNNADEERFNDDGTKEPQIGSLEDVHKDDANALLEYALYNFDLHQSTRKNALELLARHWDGMRPIKRNIDEDNERDMGAVFIAVSDDGYLEGVPDGVQYDQVVDPYTQTFIDVARKQKGMHVGAVTGAFVYALASLRIANSKRIGLVAMEAYRKGVDLSDVKVFLVDGVAGSGKTRALTEKMTEKDIMATGPRASAANIRKWCLTQDRFKDKKELVKQQFRTMDSHILAKTGRRGNRLFVDEFFMLPWGSIILLALRSGAKEIHVSGDNPQIGMIDRGAGYGKLLYTKQMFFTDIVYLNETERCPQDATYVMRSYYPEWRQPLIKTHNPLRRSIRVEVIPNAESEIYKKNTPMSNVLTFTQNDKAMTSKHAGFVDAKKLEEAETYALTMDNRPVLTVHEAQGETFPLVIVHRLNKYSNAVFSSSCHQYVAHSRHTVMMILRTVCDGSMCDFTKKMLAATNLTDEQLDEVVADELKPAVKERVMKSLTSVGKFMGGIEV